MWRGLGGMAGILFLTAVGWNTGCSDAGPRGIDEPRTSSLMFTADASAMVATQVGRSDWPSVCGRIDGAEDTYYVEYYRDYFGYGHSQSYSPQRLFRSYRIGSQHR